MLCKNCGREMPMIGKNCPFCGASTLLSRPPKKTTNTNENDETTFFIPISEDGRPDLSAFREALQGRRPTVNQQEITLESSDAPQPEPSPLTAPVQQPAGRQTAPPRPHTAPVQQPAGQQTAPPRPRTAPVQQQPAGQPSVSRLQTTPAPAQMQPAYDISTEDASASYETSRRRTRTRKKTTYYDPETNDIRHYRKRSLGQRILTKLCIIVAIAGIAAGSIYYYNSHREKPDENLVAAEKYMEHGQFDNALNAFQQALSDAKDPAVIQLQIDQLKSYQQAADSLKNKDYASAITTLNDLKGRLTDAASPLAEAVDELLTTVQSERAKSVQKPDASNESNQSDDNKSDNISNDDNNADNTSSNDNNDDTSGNSNQTTEPTTNDNESESNEEQEAAARQEELAQEKRQQQQAFSRRIGSLESDDEQISSSQDSQEKLEMTSRSFEAWDTMLADLYDTLATVASADDYAAAEQDYQQWIAERDQGAANAASENPDSEEGQLAAAQFKQSYTKTQCYKILDKLSE